MNSSLFFLLAFFAVAFSYPSDVSIEPDMNEVEESQEKIYEEDQYSNDEEFQLNEEEMTVEDKNEIIMAGKIGKCQICKEIVKVSRHVLKRGVVNKAAYMACSRYAFFIKKICKNLLSRELNKIVELLKKNYDNNRVCRKIHWC